MRYFNNFCVTVLLSMLTITAAIFPPIFAMEQHEKTITSQNSVQRMEQASRLEKQYTKKLNAIKQEITMLKDSIMLVNPAVHTPKLQTIEAQFKALNDELDKKELLGSMSSRFMQELSAVERGIFNTKKLLGIKTADEEVVEK